MSRNSLRRLLTLTLVLPVIVQWHILDRSFFQVPDPLPDVEFITPENADRLVTLYIIQTGPDSLVKVQFSPDHEVLATWSYESNDVQLWELETGSLIAKLEGHLGDVHHFAFSPDSTLLASSAGDRTVRVWDTKTGNFLYQFVGSLDSVWDVKFSPDGQLLAYANRGAIPDPDAENDHVRLWDLNANEEIGVLTHPHIAAFAFNPEGNMIATLSFDGSVKLWDWANGSVIQMVESGDVAIENLKFSSDGKTLIIGKLASTKLWDLETYSEYDITGVYLNNFVTAPYQDSVVFSDAGFSVHLYDAKTHQKIMEWDDTYTFGGFRDLSADETIVATVLVSDDNIILWDVETGEQLVTLDHPSVSNITFSPDGRYMVSNAVDGTLRLWGVLKAM